MAVQTTFTSHNVYIMHHVFLSEQIKIKDDDDDDYTTGMVWRFGLVVTRWLRST